MQAFVNRDTGHTGTSDWSDPLVGNRAREADYIGSKFGKDVRVAWQAGVESFDGDQYREADIL